MFCLSSNLVMLVLSEFEKNDCHFNFINSKQFNWSIPLSPCYWKTSNFLPYPNFKISTKYFFMLSPRLLSVLCLHIKYNWQSVFSHHLDSCAQKVQTFVFVMKLKHNVSLSLLQRIFPAHSDGKHSPTHRRWLSNVLAITQPTSDSRSAAAEWFWWMKQCCEVCLCIHYRSTMKQAHHVTRKLSPSTKKIAVFNVETVIVR